MSDDLFEMVADKAAGDPGFLERMSDSIILFFNKAVWTTAYENNLPDSAFLHILPGGKKDSEGKTVPRSNRMFPYKDAEGNVDLPHLRNAIARIPQSNRIDQSTKDSLQARARKMLGNQDQGKSVVGFYKSATDWWFLGIYSNKYEDRDEEILSEKAHEEYVKWVKETGFKPVITVLHQPKMPRQFWPIVFQKYGKDPQKLGEVVKGIYKDFGFAEAQRVMYVNGFTIVAAKVLDGKQPVAEALSKESDLGMSHGFIVTEINDNIVDSYRTFEMSVLPRKRAANPITFSLFAAKDKDMSDLKGLSSEDAQFLTRIFGEDNVKGLEAGTSDLAKKLEGIGLNFKDIEEEKVEEEDKAKKPMMDDEEMGEDMPDKETPAEDQKKPAAKKEAETPAPQSIEDIAKALGLDQLQTVLQQFAEGVQSLRDTVDAQANEIKEMKKGLSNVQKTEDEKIAEAISPAYNWAVIGQSLSKSTTNLVTEDEKKELEKAAPKGDEENHPPDAFRDFFGKSLKFDGER